MPTPRNVNEALARLAAFKAQQAARRIQSQKIYHDLAAGLSTDTPAEPRERDILDDLEDELVADFISPAPSVNLDLASFEDHPLAILDAVDDLLAGRITQAEYDAAVLSGHRAAEGP